MNFTVEQLQAVSAKNHSFHGFKKLHEQLKKDVEHLKKLLHQKDESIEELRNSFRKLQLNFQDLAPKKKGKSLITCHKKTLLLEYLGVPNYLKQLIPSQDKLSKVLEILIERNWENIDKDITAGEHSDSTRYISEIRKADNYEFVADTLEMAGLKDKAKKARQVLAEIYQEENSE